LPLKCVLCVMRVAGEEVGLVVGPGREEALSSILMAC